MAEAVPYSPIPSVTASGPTMAGVAPEAAFGGAQAQAFGNFGQISKQAGDELFTRAIALQQVTEQANANKAAADFTTQLGQLHADYVSKLGSDAVEGFAPYQKAVNDLREKVKGTLNSPYAQNLYDQDSRFMQARAIWSASEWAGQQNRAYAIAASKAKIESLVNTGVTNPDQPGLKAQVSDEIQHQTALTGASPEVASLEESKTFSQMALKGIQGAAVTDPFAAMKLRDQAIKDGKLVGTDVASANSIVQQHLYTKGAQDIAHNLMTGDAIKDMTASQQDEVARKVAESRVPGDKIFADAVSANVLALRNKALQINREDEFDRRQTVEGALITPTDGKLPSTPEELTKDPKVAAAWQALTPTDLVKYTNLMANRAVKGEFTWTPQTIAQYNEIRGIANNPTSSPDDLKRILDTNAMDLKMPFAAQQEVLKLQAKVFKGFTADPNTTYAMHVLDNMIPPDLKLKVNGAHKPEYNQLIGALHDVLKTQIEQTGHMPKDQDIRDIGTHLMENVASFPWYYGGLSRVDIPRYRQEAPSDFRKTFIQQYKTSHGGTDPTDEEINSQFVNSSYQAIYGKGTRK